MPLTKYEDFLDLSVKQLNDFLAVCGISTSGRKVELVAKAFAAVELGLSIIDSTVDQQKMLEKNYQSKISELNLPDPKQVDKLVDDMTKWPMITLGSIFAYISNKKEFNADYIGKYKDQKSYSFFDSGFVGPIRIYAQGHTTGSIYLYCQVQASQMRINLS